MAALSQLFDDISVNENVPISSHDFLMQSMSEADADVMTTILSNVEANAAALTYTEVEAQPPWTLNSFNPMRIPIVKGLAD